MQKKDLRPGEQYDNIEVPKVSTLEMHRLMCIRWRYTNRKPRKERTDTPVERSFSSLIWAHILWGMLGKSMKRVNHFFFTHMSTIAHWFGWTGWMITIWCLNYSRFVRRYVYEMIYYYWIYLVTMSEQSTCDIALSIHWFNFTVHIFQM